MASGVRKLRFSGKSTNRTPIFILIIVILLAVIGWFGWPLIKSKLNLDPVQGFRENQGGSHSTTADVEEPEGESPDIESEPERADQTIEPGPSDSSLLNTGPSTGDSSVRRILENVMTAWVSALVKGNFTQFHQMLSSSWQQKDDPASLKASFDLMVPYKENLKLFPTRGKLVLLESRPFTTMEGLDVAEGTPSIRDNPGPESPWLVRGEWRVNKTALGFTLVLNHENGQWLPTGLRVEIYK
jgi:hypothetical protein